MTPRLADFEGAWRIDRRIEDRKGALSGRFTGTATFLRDNDDLRYAEEGMLELGKAPPLRAVRRYHWAEREGRIVVTYTDGRPFHVFDPEVGLATHFCVPDVYRVTYGFADWPVWTARWDVTGPRKDYTMISRYTRPDGKAARPG